MQNKENMSLGEYIRELRKSKGVSLGEMESATGLSRSYINRLENSTRDNPTLDSISRLVKYFEIPFSTMQEFCDCGDGIEGQKQNLDFILMNDKYLFANIEVDINFRIVLKDLIKELENYCTKASICRQDEAKILDLAVILREKLLSA